MVVKQQYTTIMVQLHYFNRMFRQHYFQTLCCTELIVHHFDWCLWIPCQIHWGHLANTVVVQWFATKWSLTQLLLTMHSLSLLMGQPQLKDNLYFRLSNCVPLRFAFPANHFFPSLATYVSVVRNSEVSWWRFMAPPSSILMAGVLEYTTVRFGVLDAKRFIQNDW